ncbi:MAG TPA: VOC family protein, partial [Actinomycetota bacterium]|nr:VOC family protein [Actinomycetota bacterium]
PGGIQLAFHLRDEAAQEFQDANRKAGRPMVSFVTDDCRRDYEELRAKGVSFVSEPTEYPYGGTDAVFEDGCGNLLNLHQA